MNDIKKSIEVLKEQIIKNEKILDGLPEKARARATDLSNVVKACHVAISALEKQQKIKECLEWLKTLNENEKLIVRELIEIMESFIKEVENE